MQQRDTKTAIITGGSKGIGLAIVDDLLDNGWSVISISRSAADERENLQTIEADLSSAAGLESALTETRGRIGRADLLVNNAGIIHDTESLMNVNESDMLSSWRLHTWAPLFLTRGLIAELGQAPSPAVVNIGSVYGEIIDPDVIAYGTSKSALTYVTKALAIALAPKTRVNALLPGHVDTEMTATAPPDFVASVKAKTPLGRISYKEEIVKAVRFLASDDASFITGAALVVDGGFTITH